MRSWPAEMLAMRSVGFVQDKGGDFEVNWEPDSPIPYHAYDFMEEETAFLQRSSRGNECE